MWLLRRHSDFPSLPGELPVIGHLLALRHHAMELMWRGYRELGPVFYVNMGPSLRFLACFGPESFALFRHKGIGSDDLAFVRYRQIVGETSVLVQDGASHKHLRGAMKGPFTPSGSGEQGIGRIVFDSVAGCVKRWARAKTITLLKETQRLALEVAFQITGINSTEMEEWHHQYRELTLDLLPIPINAPGFPRYRAARANEWINRKLLDAVRAARHQPEQDTVLSAFVYAKDESGVGLSDPELLDNLRFLFFAGHETTASVMAWCVIMLAQHPELWDALAKEVSGVPSDGQISQQALKSFPIAEAIFRETLRRFGPVWYTMRCTLEWVELAGRRIPPKQRILLSPASYGMDPALYPDPDKFDISRWLNRATPLSSLDLAHFGSGHHFCLGYHIAWRELVVLLVSLVRELSPSGRRPRISGGVQPREEFLPLRHPSGATQIAFA